MKRFLWKLICEDYQVLRRSSKTIQWTFTYSGILMCLNFCFTTLGLYQYFEIIFFNSLIAILLSLFVTIVFMNIYRLCLTTMNKDETYLSFNYFFSLVARLTFVGFIGLLVVKGFESFIFFSITKILDVENYNGKILLSLFDIHYLFQWIWYLTTLLLILFILPFLIKLSVGNKSRYILEKKAIEKQLILDDYRIFKYTYRKLYYDNFNLDLEFKETFLDPPFNTRPIPDNTKLGNIDDFLNSLSTEEIN